MMLGVANSPKPFRQLKPVTTNNHCTQTTNMSPQGDQGVRKLSNQR
jgi:hypothetical protein